MSFFGVTLVLQPAVESNQWLGGIVAIGSSVVSAMAYMQVRKLGQMGEPEYRVVFYFSLTTALAGLGRALLENGPAGTPFHAMTWQGRRCCCWRSASRPCWRRWR
jgi:drug/metabolite transporter (DMT)-like permease